MRRRLDSADFVPSLKICSLASGTKARAWVMTIESTLVGWISAGLFTPLG